MHFLPPVGSKIPSVITMGDPHGIGPEVTLKALASDELKKIPAVVAGSRTYLLSLARRLDIGALRAGVEILDVGDFGFPPRWGKVDRLAGRFAIECIIRAVEYCRQRNCPLLVTAPIHKAAAHLAQIKGPGQTELLGSLYPGCEPVMAFFSDCFHVALVTTHIPLSQVSDSLNEENVGRTCRVFYRALQRLGIEMPRVAVCGLNPHASEGGLFGDEERETLIPTLDLLISEFGEGSFRGPFPSDTVFREASLGRFDGVVALYHDQGLAPLKLVAFDNAVNATLGLPIVRTSPDHGTAFEIAGAGIANPSSMISAIRWGLRLSGSV